jgi:hypothetical protein
MVSYSRSLASRIVEKAFAYKTHLLPKRNRQQVVTLARAHCFINETKLAMICGHCDLCFNQLSGYTSASGSSLANFYRCMIISHPG